MVQCKILQLGFDCFVLTMMQGRAYRQRQRLDQGTQLGILGRITLHIHNALPNLDTRTGIDTKIRTPARLIRIQVQAFVDL